MSVVWSPKVLVWAVFFGLNDIALLHYKGKSLLITDTELRPIDVVSYEGESNGDDDGRRSSCFEFFNLIFVEIRLKE